MSGFGSRIKTWISPLYSFALNLGWDPRLTMFGLWGVPQYLKDFIAFSRQRNPKDSAWPLSPSHPVFADRFFPAGTAKGHYFLQDLLIAQRIFRAHPRCHVDFGSSINGFVAHVASFRAIEIFDVRTLDLHVENITFRQCDLMNVPPELHGYCDSVSCLHVLEHLGLGRYGDSIDFDGHWKGLRGLASVLMPGGRLYLSVPVGKQRIEFNAQRVFAMNTVLELAAQWFDLDRISYIDDESRLHENVHLTSEELTDSVGMNLGCGIFELIRRPESVVSP